MLVAGRTTDSPPRPGVSLRLTASRPQVSRGRLSRSYGYPPARGYYVTFALTIVNTGSQPVDLGPPNFHVRIPGEGVVTSYDGNALCSGAAACSWTAPSWRRGRACTLRSRSTYVARTAC